MRRISARSGSSSGSRDGLFTQEVHEMEGIRTRMAVGVIVEVGVDVEARVAEFTDAFRPAAEVRGGVAALILVLARTVKADIGEPRGHPRGPLVAPHVVDAEAHSR